MRIQFGEWQVRTFRPDDAPALAKHANNRKIWRNLSHRFPHPYSIEDAEAWIRYASDQQPQTAFAIASDVEVIGAIGLELQSGVRSRSAAVGYWLSEPFWKRGITTNALRAITEYAFSNFDIARLYANVYEWNPASARVLEKAGFQLEGRLRRSVTKDGQTIDQWMYAMVRE